MPRDVLLVLHEGLKLELVLILEHICERLLAVKFEVARLFRFKQRDLALSRLGRSRLLRFASADYLLSRAVHLEEVENLAANFG